MEQGDAESIGERGEGGLRAWWVKKSWEATMGDLGTWKFCLDGQGLWVILVWKQGALEVQRIWGSARGELAAWL